MGFLNALKRMFSKQTVKHKNPKKALNPTKKRSKRTKYANKLISGAPQRIKHGAPCNQKPKDYHKKPVFRARISGELIDHINIFCKRNNTTKSDFTELIMSEFFLKRNRSIMENVLNKIRHK